MAPVTKNPAIFSAESIRAMSPIGRQIAEMLKDKGYITIVEDTVYTEDLAGYIEFKQKKRAGAGL